MIKKETIDRIVETALVEEVVGDFVQLKKRGTSMIGLCPFHNEKSPSFNVSPAKGIYKCFGCGKGGDSISFVMEHEKYSYPEALKYLAKKYNIEIEESEITPEYQAEVDRRESLYIITNYAAKFFEKTMWDTLNGQTIGLSYFRERGFRDDIIKKFELGYSPDEWTALQDKAVADGYRPEFLEETGLTVKNDSGKVYDRFRGRVMFPIHNFTGRIIGFGGRTLKTDKNVPKYVNSPESDIYHKSNVLYGLFQAKKAIRDLGNCYLVEGYADVLSVQQAGVENVVASSGTSLTTEQIRLIGRFTKNVTILFDGDAAGIKASLRGLDMILEEGLDVKVVLFPDGHDPDSYIQKLGSAAFKTHIELKQQDFIFYKTQILLKEAANDPIKKAGVIREIIESIAKIPDAIKASVFVRECSGLLNVEERILIAELNKIKLTKLKKDYHQGSNSETRNHLPAAGGQKPENSQPETQSWQPEAGSSKPETLETDEYQERELIRVLITYGDVLVNWDEMTDTYIGPYIITNLSDITFNDKLCERVITYYHDELDKGIMPTEKTLIQHPDKEIKDLAIALISSPYMLSANWYNMHHINVPDEKTNLKATIMGAIFHLKKKKIATMVINKQKEMQAGNSEEQDNILMKDYLQLKEVEKYISNYLGSVIIK
ncbi:MAG: DNA primase [Sphingobacteriales bacterium]|nr:MAG: DNA primase [Sphingobacteriales bacterium]